MPVLLRVGGVSGETRPALRRFPSAAASKKSEAPSRPPQALIQPVTASFRCSYRDPPLVRGRVVAVLQPVVADILSGIGVGDERLEIDRKLDLAPSGQFPTHHQPDQQIGRRCNLSPPGFKSRQVLRGHPKLLSEHFPAHHELFSQKPDLRSRQHGPLSDQQVHEQSMELFSVRNLDFLVSVTAFPDRCVDQLHVVQSRLPVVDRRVDKLLGRSTIGAPPRRSFARQFQNPVTIVMRAHAGSSATTTVS